VKKEGEMKKVILVLLVVAFCATPAFGGNRPEYDAVACDYTNFFSYDFNVARIITALTNLDGNFQPINLYSDFSYRAWYYDKRGQWPEFCYLPEVVQKYDEEITFDEFFENSAGQCWRDPCFGFFERSTDGSRAIVDSICGFVPCIPYYEYYESALTDAYNEGIYTWQIVLQMKPESDINLKIQDCVLKHNGVRPWDPYCFQHDDDFLHGGDDAEQTGRYRASWGQLFFVPSANPVVTVKAIPGPFATPGFTDPVTLDARQMPGLGSVPLEQALYTTKAVWEEGIVMVLPETGTTNQSGETVYNLKQGDKINVTVAIPPNNSVDVRYGPDNVLLEYVGIVGTEYVSKYFCPGCLDDDQ
jgi:hypothetical protein